MKTMLWKKMLRDMKRSWSTYMLCIVIVAVGFCGYSVLELASENLARSEEYFFQVTEFCQGFAVVEKAPEAVAKSLERINGVAKAEGRLEKTISVTGYDREVQLKLVSLHSKGMNQPLLSKGSLPVGKCLVLGDAMSKARGLKPGQTMTLVINGKHVELEISGIGITPENIYMIKDMGEMFPSPETYDAGFMDYDTMSALFSESGMVNAFLFQLEPGVVWADVEEQIEDELAPYGCYQLYGSEDQLSVSMLNEELTQLDKMSGVVPFLFLFVAAVILYITLSRLVDQQRIQIGTLLAMGISMKKIQVHYMLYGAFVGLTGGLLGGGSGYLLADPMADYYRVYFNLPSAPFDISWSYLFTGIAMATFFCGAVAWVVAGSFRELNPAVALRPPAPKAARRSFLEKIPGMAQIFTVPGMMALRGLARNRRRTILSLLGIAFAYMITASLVSMTAMFDVFIFDYWEDTQRQDIMIQFQRPVAAVDAMEAVRHPEIQLAEGVVDLSVTLKGPAGTVDCMIQGIDPGSSLCRLYTEDGKSVQVQEEGIVLSRHMANLMGVGIGDFIEVKAMYPKEKLSRTPVTAIINQYMGSTAYMSYEGVGKISEYRNVYTSVLLKAPLPVQEELITKLKEATAVTGIENRHQRLEGYRTMMGNMSGMIAVMCSMGVLIGCVVIYISSLIGFEELKREVATLMALGLRDRQCLEVISTGQWILTIGAIILGIPMTMGVSRWISVAMASELYTIPDFVSGEALLQAIGLTCLSVLFSSWMMLRKIKKISPVELLRERE